MSPGEQPPVTELIQDLAADLRTLLHQELDLLRAETARSARRAARGGVLLGGAAVFGGLAAGTSAAAALRFLEGRLSPRTAAAVLTAGYAGVAGGLATAGVAELRRADLRPRRTIDSVKEDLQWPTTTSSGSPTTSPGPAST